MGEAQLIGRSAVELAGLVHDGAVSPIDVVSAHLDWIERQEPRFGAFEVVCRGQAVADAERLAERGDLAELPLAGVPVAIKDIVDVAGLPTRYGSTLTPDAPATADDESVSRLRGAGAVIVGKTRVPEFAIWGTTESSHGGVTRNPWDPERNAGGSSGGSAAAVAAGMVPLALAHDGLGSVRIPAAVCGLVGVKPGMGIVPTRPFGRDGHWFGLTVAGPLATTVGDAALAMDVLTGDGYANPSPPQRSLRVAVSVASPLVGVRVAPEVRDTVFATADVLSGAGHQVTHADPPYPPSLASSVLARWVAGAAEASQGYDLALLEPRTRRHMQLGRLVNRVRPPQWREAERWRSMVDRWFGDYDLLVTPVLARLPVQAAPWHARPWLVNIIADSMYAPFSAAWNLASYPALALPSGRHQRGFSVATQLVAPTGGEHLLLSVAAQLERLRPWPRHPPTVVAV